MKYIKLISQLGTQCVGECECVGDFLYILPSLSCLIGKETSTYTAVAYIYSKLAQIYIRKSEEHLD